jgi:hypothetical protein
MLFNALQLLRPQPWMAQSGQCSMVMMQHPWRQLAPLYRLQILVLS